jgi:hypothetical protein
MDITTFILTVKINTKIDYKLIICYIGHFYESSR